VSITNLTPHPIRIYGWDVPDQFALGDHEPTLVLEPSGTVARIGEIELGTQYMTNVPTPVEFVEYGHSTGLPPLPSPRPRVSAEVIDWYVVSLALALAFHRSDLLVPFREVRNLDGTVIGCRSLALPC
jgi:hypothetical protein